MFVCEAQIAAGNEYSHLSRFLMQTHTEKYCALASFRGSSLKQECLHSHCCMEMLHFSNLIPKPISFPYYKCLS